MFAPNRLPVCTVTVIHNLPFHSCFALQQEQEKEQEDSLRELRKNRRSQSIEHAQVTACSYA